MAITIPYELSGSTITNTEASITGGNVTIDGAYQLWVDGAAAMVKGDAFRARVYETVRSGGTQRLALTQLIRGAQVEPWVFPDLMLLHSWNMTLQRESATSRAFDASVRAQLSGITEPYSRTALSVGATEVSIVSGTTTLQSVAAPGYYQLWVDPLTGPMVGGDKFVARIYETVRSGGTKRQVWETQLEHAPTALMFSPVLKLARGCDFTLQSVGGTTRTFDCSVRKVA
jgi:hypothetical protein